MRELIYKDEAYKAIDNCIRDSWHRISPTDAKMNIYHLVSDANEADRPQGEWIEIGTISHSYKCSVCGRTLFHITVGKNHVAKYYPYCHCGAKMKGVDDEASD